MSSTLNEAPTYVDRAEVDEVFADGLERISLDRGVRRLEFSVHRRDDQTRVWAYTAARIGLSPGVERLLVGFMGCYAAVAALRSARHIVRSEPGARVLVVCVELCSLHLQDTAEIEPLLAMLQFGDGAAAALVTSEAIGFALDAPFATTLPDSAGLIRWDITDRGFAMHLSGEVPGRIAEGLADPGFAAAALGGRSAEDIDGWAVHAGGRSILDAVESAYALPQGARPGRQRAARVHRDRPESSRRTCAHRPRHGAWAPHAAHPRGGRVLPRPPAHEMHPGRPRATH